MTSRATFAKESERRELLRTELLLKEATCLHASPQMYLSNILRFEETAVSPVYISLMRDGLTPYHKRREGGGLLSSHLGHEHTVTATVALLTNGARFFATFPSLRRQIKKDFKRSGGARG